MWQEVGKVEIKQTHAFEEMKTNKDSGTKNACFFALLVLLACVGFWYLVLVFFCPRQIFEYKTSWNPELSQHSYKFECVIDNRVGELETKTTLLYILYIYSVFNIVEKAWSIFHVYILHCFILYCVHNTTFACAPNPGPGPLLP
jgi:hypothetical protein